jgi:hypothetical protein
MKDIYNILEKEKDVDVIKISDEDYAEYFKENPEQLQKFIKDVKDSDESEEKKKEILKALHKIADKEVVSESLSYINESVILTSIITGLAVGAAAQTINNAIVKKKVKNCKEQLEHAVSVEKDEEKRAELEKKLKSFTSLACDKDGKPLNIGMLSQNIIKKRSGSFKWDKYIKELNDTTKPYKDQAAEKEEPKEETVKDKSGVEWIKRKKERGEGYTYCKKDDRSVTMSQDEYNKRNASKSKNESQYISLKDYLVESIQ